MFRKNEQVGAAIEWVFFLFLFASQRVNKNRSSTLHGMMFLFHTCRDVFLLTNTLQRLEANDHENTSFVQSEKQTIVLHTVNLSMYGDKAALEIIRIWTLWYRFAFALSKARMRNKVHLKYHGIQRVEYLVLQTFSARDASEFNVCEEQFVSSSLMFTSTCTKKKISSNSSSRRCTCTGNKTSNS